MKKGKNMSTIEDSKLPMPHLLFGISSPAFGRCRRRQEENLRCLHSSVEVPWRLILAKTLSRLNARRSLRKFESDFH